MIFLSCRTDYTVLIMLRNVIGCADQSSSILPNWSGRMLRSSFLNIDPNKSLEPVSPLSFRQGKSNVAEFSTTNLGDLYVRARVRVRRMFV